MSLYRLLLRSLQTHHPTPPRHLFSLSHRSFAFSSAEEAAAERRRRKRRLRIEPPLHALRRDPSAPRPRPDPNAPRLPDSTSALVGPRLNLHNRVQSLIRSSDLDSASSTARQAVFSNTRPTVFTCNAIMAAMYRAKRFDDSIALFHYFFNQSNIVPNIVSYNVLINTHCDAGRVDTALDVYRHVLANAPFSPSHVTYRHLVKGLIDSGRIAEAVDLLREMLNKGHGADSLVYNTLIGGFIQLDNMERALEFFDELRERCLVYDGVVHATIMEGYFKKGMEKEAMDSYRALMDRQFKMNAVTCNTLLEVLLKYNKYSDALALFDHMAAAHAPPNFLSMNMDSYNLIVNEFIRLGKFLEVVAVFRKKGTKPCVVDVEFFNKTIGKLCENGLVSDAEKVFDEMPDRAAIPDMTTIGFLVDGYLKEGRVDDALRCYNKMFVHLVEKDKAEDAVDFFKKMGEREVTPDLMSYESLVKVLCKRGKLDLGCHLLEEMVKNGFVVSQAFREDVSEYVRKERWSDEVQRIFEEKAGTLADSSSTAPQVEQVAA